LLGLHEQELFNRLNSRSTSGKIVRSARSDVNRSANQPDADLCRPLPTSAATPFTNMPRNTDRSPPQAPLPSLQTPHAPRLVPAVERTSRLLDALADAHEPLSLAELARRLSLPRSSLHGLLATLVELDLARRNDEAEFSLGPRALRWADAFTAQSDLMRAFEAHARRIAALGTETIMLATLEGREVTYLACRQGSRPLAVNFRVGGRFPAVCTSSGKAMLASLDDKAVRLALGDGPLPRLTRHGITSLASLRRQLDDTRRDGHAIDDEETAEGMQCFGAPVFGARGLAAVAAVAVSVIKAGLTTKRRAELILGIRQLAADISTELGAPPPATMTARSQRTHPKPLASRITINKPL
jgi:DNA-binding IclR family transcriptional regulator